jgi:hypothetical protein
MSWLMSATVTFGATGGQRKAMSPVPPAMSRIASPCARLHAAHEAVLPQPVHPARHGVVHHVILAGDAGKDRADPLRSFLRGLTSS